MVSNINAIGCELTAFSSRGGHKAWFSPVDTLRGSPPAEKGRVSSMTGLPVGLEMHGSRIERPTYL